MTISLPSRCNQCVCGKESFDSGLSYVTYLFENQREDYCLSCWDKIKKEKKIVDGIYWKGKVPPKKEKPLTKDEKALAYFQEQKEGLGVLYVLALYLERRKQLVKRPEHKGKVVFEVPLTGEIYALDKISITKELVDQVLKILDDYGNT